MVAHRATYRGRRSSNASSVLVCSFQARMSLMPSQTCCASVSVPTCWLLCSNTAGTRCSNANRLAYTNSSSGERSAICLRSASNSSTRPRCAPSNVWQTRRNSLNSAGSPAASLLDLLPPFRVLTQHQPRVPNSSADGFWRHSGNLSDQIEVANWFLPHVPGQCQDEGFSFNASAGSVPKNWLVQKTALRSAALTRRLPRRAGLSSRYASTTAIAASATGTPDAIPCSNISA